MLITALCSLLVASTASPAAAPRAADLESAPRSASAWAAPRGEDTLDYSWTVDGAIILTTGTGWIGSELFKNSLAPQTCGWCRHNGLDDAVTRRLAWHDIKAAATTGDLTGFVLTPLLSVGMLALAANSEDRLEEMPANALLIVEAITISSAVNQIAKFSAGRERPFVSDLPLAQKGLTAHPADNNLSFYSGHSNLVFALAVSAGTIAHIRGYEGEPYVWGVGVPVAAFVAYSRIAAKKHYLTDVLVGSAAGAAFGFALPWFFHRDTGPSALTLTPLPNGALLSGRF